MRTSLRLGLIALAVCLSNSIATAQTWTNAGNQFFPVSFNLTVQQTAEEFFYVQPGQSIIFQVGEILEYDRFTPASGDPEFHDDPEKEGRLSKTTGTAPGTWSVTVTAPGFFTYTVPANAAADQTIFIKADLHDTRAETDRRHDGWSTKSEWKFKVRLSCPDTITVHANNDQTPGVTAGATYGTWRMTMQVNGGVPGGGAANWNGLILTEAVGPLAPTNAANFIAPWNTTAANSNDSTFIVGEAGDNRFYDTHSDVSNATTLSLQPGVAAGTRTQSQVYFCSTTKSYSFTITHTHNRVGAGTPAEHVKIAVTKN